MLKLIFIILMDFVRRKFIFCENLQSFRICSTETSFSFIVLLSLFKCINISLEFWMEICVWNFEVIFWKNSISSQIYNFYEKCIKLLKYNTCLIFSMFIVFISLLDGFRKDNCNKNNKVFHQFVKKANYFQDFHLI